MLDNADWTMGKTWITDELQLIDLEQEISQEKTWLVNRVMNPKKLHQSVGAKLQVDSIRIPAVFISYVCFVSIIDD